MKTLLFTLEYPPFKGGVANYYGNMAKYWPINEKLAVLDNSKQELISDGCCFSWLPAVSALNRKLDQAKIDYVLAGQILPLGTAALIVSLFRPLKYGVFLHGMDFSWALKKFRKKWLSYLILKKADKILCANSYVLDKLHEVWPALSDKAAVFNPGIEGGAPIADQKDLDYLKEKYNLEGKTVLFSLGRLVKRKGFDRVIETLVAMPPEKSQNLVYFIAGKGHREEYLKSLVPLRFAKKIVFLGALSEREKWAWFHLCDIFLMPSRDITGDFEGFGIVYLEANLCGKPVIAGDSGGIKDAVINGETGLVVNSDNLEEVSAAISVLAENESLRHKLGITGQNRALKDFNWEKRAEEIAEFIKITKNEKI